MDDFLKQFECYMVTYQPLDPDLDDRSGDPGVPGFWFLGLFSGASVSCRLQGAVLHRGDERGTPVPGEPGAGLRPE